MKFKFKGRFRYKITEEKIQEKKEKQINKTKRRTWKMNSYKISINYRKKVTKIKVLM